MRLVVQFTPLYSNVHEWRRSAVCFAQSEAPAHIVLSLSSSFICASTFNNAEANDAPIIRIVSMICTFDTRGSRDARLLLKQVIRNN